MPHTYSTYCIEEHKWLNLKKDSYEKNEEIYKVRWVRLNEKTEKQAERGLGLVERRKSGKIG